MAKKMAHKEEKHHKDGHKMGKHHEEKHEKHHKKDGHTAIKVDRGVHGSKKK